MARIWDACSHLLLVRTPCLVSLRNSLTTSFASFGAAFVTFYRLVGPFRSDSAPAIIKTELWDTITRRGILGNLLMGVIPMLFYFTLNACAYLAEKLGRTIGIL